MSLLERIVPLGIPLAWLNLIQERRRFLAAVSGIMFAVTLMLFQMGLNTALFLQVVSPLVMLEGDIALVSPQYEYFGISRTVPGSRLQQALSHPAVEEVSPLYLINLPLKNPETGRNRDIFIIGFDPSGKVWRDERIQQLQPLLKVYGNALVDELSRPEFGAFQNLLQASPEGVQTEVNGSGVKVCGLFSMGTTFAADGNLLVGTDTFMKIFPLARRNLPSLGILRLEAGADSKKVSGELDALLPDDVQVMTREEFIEYEKTYWSIRTPIGFVIGASMAVALVVGAVIVYQILYTDVNDHLEEYATLKSIGFRDSFFNSLILQSSLILSIMGFIPGILLAALLYHFTRTYAYMPTYLSLEKGLTVFLLTLGMCMTAGAFATRKLKAANPADLF